MRGLQSYRQLMEVVLDESNWPVLIHCSAGKDRSGIAIALILEALGVDRETIMQEYLLTNEISLIEEKAVMLSRESKNAGRGSKLSKGTRPAPGFRSWAWMRRCWRLFTPALMNGTVQWMLI